MAKLVFTNDLTHIKALGRSKNLNVHCNENSMKVLRKMGKQDLFVVTDPLLMRGFDYRSKCGIALLIAAPLDNSRAYMQALGRAGRMDEQCKRFVIEGIETVDKVKKTRSLERLVGRL